MFVLLFSISSLWASQLDLSTTSTEGCASAWVDECILNPVAGPIDSLSMGSCGSAPFVVMDADATNNVAIGFVREPVGSGDKITAVVTGEAMSVDTVVAARVRYFNASNQIVGAASHTVHALEAGPFSALTSFGNIPTDAETYNARITAMQAPVLLYYGFFNPTGDGDDSEDCEVECNDGTTAYGQRLGSGPCDAFCQGDLECEQ